MHESIQTYTKLGIPSSDHKAKQNNELSCLVSGHDLPNSDDVVGVTSEQSLTVSGPSQRDSVWFSGLGVTSEFWLQFIDQRLWIQTEDLDTRSGSSRQPVSVWRESQSEDFILSTQGVHSRLVSQVPQHDFTVLTSGSDQRTIWRSSNGVNVVVVTDEVSFDLELVNVPCLFKFVSKAEKKKKSS